ncbi:HD domain-containing protein [Oceanirhabdus sp. W0125-5]|uniref:HD domain-containing protein n=1 Tax=Oceanirhabdus sp. W0125-5 TaxID=2999116 RepID=UPI0022F2CCF9|nr:HD domain-containing protein [Oceanirhabdus sp. W0125-5]WBW97532.1 HD domain-containing protein [Oceanirhabdus sp. W0125-5]
MDRYNDIIIEMKKELGSRGHDIDHILRVYKLAVSIANKEKTNYDIDMEVLELSAILHDIGRKKEDEDKTGKINHADIGADMAEILLKDKGYTQDKINKIKSCIRSHRYRGNNIPKKIEEKILFDADKLDSLGAIGVGRCFMVAAQFNQRIYNDTSVNEYIKTNTYENMRLKDPSIHAPNLEYELKMKNIKDRLFTESAKEIAEERDEFMKEFFDRMKDEINGIK